MNKQIEEIDRIESVLWEANHKKSVLDYRWLAQAVYNADYRKVSQEGAECPTCHGTGRIGTTDWLTRGIDKEKLAKEREEALAEYEAQKKQDLARKIFIDLYSELVLLMDYKGKSAIATAIFKAIEKVDRKYTESEGADDEQE